MPAPSNNQDLVQLIRKSGLIAEEALGLLQNDKAFPQPPDKAAKYLIQKGLLTKFQADHLLAGRSQGMVIGPYHLLALIGKGGVGLVFMARHAKLRTRVAIKVLAPRRASEKEALGRFLREGRAVSSLNHPNIVGGLEANRWEKLYYLVMEYVEGITLEKLVQRQGPLPCAKAVDYVSQVASGLEHAHQNGMVHRDIKPSNLLLDKQGVVKILDLGLARSFEEKDGSLTEDFAKGALLGTADYLAPEQAVRFHTVDIRADIYSLGATLYTLLVGQPPFHESKLVQKLMDHQLAIPVAPHEIRRDIPQALSAIVLKMMAKKPEKRYATPADLIKALAEFSSRQNSTLNDINLQATTDTIKLHFEAPVIVRRACPVAQRKCAVAAEAADASEM